MQIQNNDNWGAEPLDLPLSNQFFDRYEFRPGWMSNTSYHLYFKVDRLKFFRTGPILAENSPGPGQV